MQFYSIMPHMYSAHYDRLVLLQTPLLVLTLHTRQVYRDTTQIDSIEKTVAGTLWTSY